MADYDSYLPRPVRAADDSTAALQQRANLFSGSILKDHDDLCKGIDRHGATLQQVWQSLSRQQRAAVLRAADTASPIPERKRPDFEHLRPDNQFQALGAAQYRRALRRAFLAPYLNIEQLQEGDNLLLLLDSRARFMPCNFIFSDAELAHIESSELLAKADSGVCSLKIADGKTAATYGIVVPNSMLGSRDVSVPLLKGLLALEAQAILYRYLNRVMKEVLKPMQLDLRDETISMLPVNPISVPPMTDRSFTGVLARTAYRPPNTFEPHELHAKVDSFLAALTEDLAELHSNPKHLKEVIELVKSSLKLELRLTRNRLRHAGKLQNRPGLGKMALWRLTRDTYGSLFYWNLVKETLGATLPLLQELGVNVTQVEIDPQRYRLFLDSFLGLDLALLALIWFMLEKVKSAVTCLPAFMDAYENCPDKNTKEMQWDITKATLPSSAAPELKRLHRLFSMLFNDDAREKHHIYRIMDELERAVAEDRDGNQYITSFAMEAISELHLAVGLSHQLQAFQPHQTLWRQQHNAIVANRLLIQTHADGILQAASTYMLAQGLDNEDSRLAWPEGDDTTKQTQRDDAKEVVRQCWAGLAYALGHTDVQPPSVTQAPRKAAPPPGSGGHGITSLDLEAPFRELLENTGAFVSQLDLDSESAPSGPDGSLESEANSGSGHLPDLEELSIASRQRERLQKDERSRGVTENFSTKAQTVLPPPQPQSHVNQDDAEALPRPFKSWANASTLTGDKPTRFKSDQPAKKTRRRDETPLADHNAGEQAEEEEELTPATSGPIPVNEDTYKAFDFMLHITGRNLGGEIKWDDVKSAMTKIGFEAYNLAGSIWQFSHDTFGRINAHEPHPKRKWDWLQARWFGGRLRRNFGFNEDTFVLE
ncbi:hypothetical protein HII31_02588 [Pseudocercospora fuligena]|uniref:Uncharacterized protein n=1 Tax=Pseudocercospora fuligena TaxID=685502 RepID=A0A8H6RRX8_9PEZI|nr:hypothetical protein HII31_02588 [Pseudocercospora fuligena]